MLSYLCLARLARYNKKGIAANMMWIIIVAILAILVLLIVFVLAGKMGGFADIVIKPYR